MIRGVENKGLIVAFRAPVLADGRTGREEKSPIHVADVVRMSEANLKLNGVQCDLDDASEINVGKTVESNPDSLRHEEAVADKVKTLGSDKRVKFVRRGLNKPETSEVRADIDVPQSSRERMSGKSFENDDRRVTDLQNSSNSPADIDMPKSSRARMSGKSFENDDRRVTDLQNSSNNPVVTSVPTSNRARKSGKSFENDDRRVTGLSSADHEIPSRIVTRYNDASTDADMNKMLFDENSLPPTELVLEDTADSQTQQQLNSTLNKGQGQETFVSYKWGRYEPVTEKVKEPEVVEGKRVRTQRNVFNAGEQGSTLAAMETDRTVDDDGLESATSETAPESFNDAVKDQRWRDSMQAEIKALKNRGV